MQFKNEYELQAFIHSFVGGQREVKFSDDSRIDILTNRYAIEVKPKLTRTALLLALGQSTIYKTNCPDRVHVVAGLTPKNKPESYATAGRVKQAGTQVWYVDQMPQFIEHWEKMAKPPAHGKVPQHVNEPDEQYIEEPFWKQLPVWAWGLIILAAWLLESVTSSGGYYQPTSTYQPVSIPMFSEPNLGATVTGSIPTTGNIEISECQGQFVKVQYENKSGWVRDASVGRRCLTK